MEETAQRETVSGCVNKVVEDIEKISFEKIQDEEISRPDDRENSLDRQSTILNDSLEAEKSADTLVITNDKKPKSEDNNEKIMNRDLNIKTQGGNENGPGDAALEVNDSTGQLNNNSVTLLKDVAVSKTVGLHETEEGELDYEEEGIADAENHQEDGQEEGEIVDDKEAEGSEEGEIVSDDEDQQASAKKDDKEEGELNKDDLEEGQLDEALERGHQPRTLCKYYEAGTCRWGVACRFLHPGINDKGNYLMHRPPGMYPTAFGKPPPPSEIGPLNSIMQNGPPPPMIPAIHPHGFIEGSPFPIDPQAHSSNATWKETAWERGLKKAKEIKLTSQKRREEDENFDEKRLNLSVKETKQDVEKPSPTIRREQWRPGFEREGQTDRFTPRVRPPDHRPEVNDRKFSRGRKSSPKRYEPERERSSRGHDFNRERPRDMAPERFNRLQRRRSPTPPERRQRERDREKDKQDVRRDKRSEPRYDKARDAREDQTKKTESENRLESSKEEAITKQEELPKEQRVESASNSMEAEQWRDPWMRTQAPITKSPETKSSPQKAPSNEDISSVESSASDSDSESEESEESGSDSGSDSKESTEEKKETNKEKEKVVEPALPVRNKETEVKSPPKAPSKDPRLKDRPGSDRNSRRHSPKVAKEANRPLDRDRHPPPHWESRESDRRRYGGEPARKGYDRPDERDRRHRERRDGYNQNANTFQQWPPSHYSEQARHEPTWQRGGYHQFSGNSYRSMGGRGQRPDEDPRLTKFDRNRSRRRSSSRSPKGSPHSRKPSNVRDPRRGTYDQPSTADRDRNTRRTSPKQKDPRTSEPDRLKRKDEEARKKETTVGESAGIAKERSEQKTDQTVNDVKIPNIEPVANHSDVSEDEFASPKYKESGSDSDSESESESESESGSDVESEAGSASPNRSVSGKSGTESDGDDDDEDDDDDDSDSDSGSDIASVSSKSDASATKPKELEKKMAKASSTAQKGAKIPNSSKSNTSSAPSSKDQGAKNDPRIQIGQKRATSGQGSSHSSPKGGFSKTAARKDELLKELKAIEDAIARKRSKIE